MRNVIAITAFIALAGCETDNRFLAAPTASERILPEATRIYEFVEHGPTIELDRHDPRSGASCLATCLADWQAHYDACAESGTLGDAGCRAAAHEASAVCAELICPATVGRDPGRCAATCDAEARSVGGECVAIHGFDDSCLREADAVYSTCYQSECSLQPSEGLAEAVQDLIDEPAHVEEPMTCHEKCKAYDLSIYLHCVQSGVDAAFCRERVGAAEHVCVQDHCPAE